MNPWEAFKQFASTVRPHPIHLHGVAAAGAMLTCVAIALNLGPFAKPESFSLAIDTAHNEAMRLASDADIVSSIPNGPASEPQASAEIIKPTPVIDVANTPMPSALPADSSVSPAPEPALVELTASVPLPPSPAERSDTREQPPHDAVATVEPASLRQADDADNDNGKNASIVGVWAPNVGTCSARDFREGALPAVISTDGAWAGETFCMFSSKKQTDTGWSVIAKCSSPKERWTANVRLTVKDNRLTWTSKRGTQAYSRCAPDVLMAAAR